MHETDIKDQGFNFFGISSLLTFLERRFLHHHEENKLYLCLIVSLNDSSKTVSNKGIPDRIASTLNNYVYFYTSVGTYA